MLLTPWQLLSSEENMGSPLLTSLSRNGHGSPISGTAMRMPHLSENNGSAGSATAGSGSSERGVLRSNGSSTRVNGVGSIAPDISRSNHHGIVGRAVAQSGGQISQPGAGAGAGAGVSSGSGAGGGAGAREKSSQQTTGAVTGVESGQRRPVPHDARTGAASQTLSGTGNDAGGGGGSGNSSSSGVSVASVRGGSDAVPGVMGTRQNAASRSGGGNNGNENQIADGASRGRNEGPMKAAGGGGEPEGFRAAAVAGGGGSAGKSGAAEQGSPSVASAGHDGESGGQEITPMDKEALQSTLMNLLQDDRFVDMLHSRYVSTLKWRSTRDFK